MTTQWKRMGLRPWAGSAALPFALPLLMCALLVSCSVPDGPNPGDTVTLPTDSTTGSTVDSTTADVSPPITLNGPGQLLPVSATAEIKGKTFELEVAQTNQEQALGLMFRSALPDNRGMLFPFSSPRRTSFWMKDVPVALDMVFIRSGEVIAIAPQVPPCPAEPCPSYGPDGQIVDMVLELRSGRAAEIGLQPGDTVTISPLSSGQ